MSPQHKVIMIPGLGDAVIPMTLVTLLWNFYGLHPIVISLDWEKGKDFEPKLKKITDLIDKLHREGNKVSLVGASAGSCAALNAFFERKNEIHKIISVSGRLRTGSSEDLISFREEKELSPAFAEAVAGLMKKESSLSKDDRNRILTTRSSTYDHMVPMSTSTIEGVRNIDIPVSGHLKSIFMALSIWSKPLMDFLKAD